MPIFKCSYCYFECWPLVKDIVKHYDTWHPDKKVFPCETCGKLFTRKHDLGVHKKEAHSETKEKQLQCLHCEYKALRKSHLNRHVESKHNKSNFACSICNKSFNRKDNLKMHMKTHEEKTIQYGGGGEKEKEDNEASSLNDDNLESEDTTSSGDDSDSDILVPIHEDKSAFNGMLFERIYKRIGHKDILICLRDYKENYFKDLIEKYLKKFQRLKFYVVVKCNLEKWNHDGLLEQTSPHFHSKMHEIGHITHYDDLMKGAINRVNRRFENYVSHGSGWILTNIENVILKIVGFDRRV